MGKLEINKVYHGDCLDIMKQLDDCSIDLIVTDPPYNLGKGFLNDDLNKDSYIRFLSERLNEMCRVIKDKHSVILFFDNGKNLPLFWKSLFKSNLVFQKGCTWYKPNDCTYPHNRVLRKSDVFYICSKTKTLNHKGDKFIHDCIITKYLRIDKSFHHPTAKTMDVIKEIILSHSIKGDLVLDPFLGSGTTAIVCNMLKRNWIGIEIDKGYVDLSNKRILKFNKQSYGRPI